MIYFDKREDRLVGKCDACGIVKIGYKGETDRTEFTCGFFKEEGWLQRKEGARWKHYCPECKEEFYRQRREAYFKREANA